MSENKIGDGGPAFPVSTEDMLFRDNCSGMTLRQYAAIKLKVPNSGTDWLDEMILESLRNDLAAKAITGIVAISPGFTNDDAKYFSERAYRVADATLEARQKPRVEGV